MDDNLSLSEDSRPPRGGRGLKFVWQLKRRIERQVALLAEGVD